MSNEIKEFSPWYYVALICCLFIPGVQTIFFSIMGFFLVLLILYIIYVKFFKKS